ncbi:bifunctional protein FolD 1, mitochondrial isoform X1 [Dendrobium catenatum]|uniref:bifunctional protein FolD 1, mitochondrial isoform X1 n=1 Tax=Dendrobium catenatum TaxID=906689 RepID=UPI0009F48750|nr:bifunctional protein FolD 1, mitochondrial isoform X1 [Dendrobium catenatum]
MKVLFTTLRRRLVGSPLRPPALTSLFNLFCPRKYEAERAWRLSSSYILGPDLPDIWKHPSSAPPTLPSHSTNQGGDDLNPTIINGKIIAEELRTGIAAEIRQMKDATGKIPGLAVVLVGKRRDSQSYVRHKIRDCEEVGINSFLDELPEDCPQDDVVNAVSNFNKDPSVHGILVQLPLPKHMDEEKVLNTISLEKDVDGFHPLNVGNLAIRGREPLFIPCAAKACIELLLRSGVELVGKNVVVIGRSRVVGLPTSLLLQRHHATVSVVHAHSKDPDRITREADIVISAAGVPNLVRRNWLKRGAVVIDVGTSPVDDPSSEHGYCLTGDVCYEEALQLVSAITPVPGGVGPVTVAMLLSNTLDSAKRAFGLS